MSQQQPEMMEILKSDYDRLMDRLHDQDTTLRRTENKGQEQLVVMRKQSDDITILEIRVTEARELFHEILDDPLCNQDLRFRIGLFMEATNG